MLSTEKLFSIVVATYNQENLLETCLNSILKQTYKRIEVVISDDCSIDKTVEVADSWLRKNRSRFVKSEIIVQETNQGISKNHSDGMLHTSGSYVKYIAGDDFLQPSAIESFAEFLNQEKCSWGQALVIPHYGSSTPDYLTELFPSRNRLRYFSYDAQKQFKLLCRGNFICAPGVFFRRSMLEDVGFFDPEFRMYEDWHTWLKLTLAGNSIRLLRKPLVFWRRHDNSVSYSAFKRGNIAYFLTDLQVIEKYITPNIEKLDYITREHIKYQTKYLNALVKKGANHEAHLVSRSIKLKDPLWWLQFPNYLRNKMMSLFSSIDHK